MTTILKALEKKMQITGLYVYPIKSCRGIAVDSVAVSATGLENDRRWMIVDLEGKFVTQRELPKMACIIPELTEDGLQLRTDEDGEVLQPFSHRGQRSIVEIFGERLPAIAGDPKVDIWLNKVLNHDVRLVEFDDTALRLGGVQYPTRDDAPTTFVDNYGILAISESSLSDLRSKSGKDIPMNRFRPNVVLDDLEPFQEDFISVLHSDAVSFRFVNPCTRCQMPSIDQATGEQSFDPVAVLSTYRYDDVLRGTKFGAYAAVQSGVGKSIRTGDALSVEWAF
jgi:uncharacterized protein